jgi:MFS family permease
LGFSDQRIGLLLTMTLLGDTAISLWITTRADRLGRKRMLIAGSALMLLGGLVFALTNDFLLLLLAATVGVLSPSGNEVGPFLAIEQAALAQTIDDRHRTHVFAWFHLTGAFATAAGALTCGVGVQTLEKIALTPLQCFRVVLFAYAVAGVVLAILFTRLSSAAEAKQQGAASKEEKPSQHRIASSLNPHPSSLRSRWGLHQSLGVVLKLSGLFALDAFAGGFVLQSIMAYWFYVRFQADPATLGGIFFGANLLSGFSALAAARIARRIGLVNTMVFTHIPSNVFLLLVPFMPNLPLAISMLLLRFAISQMDVPARQSYTVALVNPDERSAAAGITGVARTTGAALSPALAGLMLASLGLIGAPFVVSGLLKLIYDGLLFGLFRRVKLPENVTRRSQS